MQWISIKDKGFPKREERVLIIDDRNDIYVGYLSPHSDMFFCYCNCHDGSYIDNPKYWMPLPLLPNDKV